jgi:diacylglycerol kinase family enzyme
VAADQVLIFANPIAGRGRSRDMAARLERRLRRDGYAVRVLFDRPESVPDAVLPADATVALVIGGDGTLRAVADRLLAPSGVSLAGVTAGQPEVTVPPPAAMPPLLVIPLGTANLMGRHLGIKWDEANLEDQVSRAVARRQVSGLDAARANGRLFLLMAGIGFDAHVVHELDRVRDGPIGYASYILPAAMAFGSYQYPSLRVTVDGREVFTPAPAVAFVGNVAEYGTGFPMLPHARPDDGLLDVCVLPCGSRGDVMRLFLQAAVGEHVLADGVVYTKGKRVIVETAGPRPAPIQLDGDAFGQTPLTVDLLPVRLPFIVP